MKAETETNKVLDKKHWQTLVLVEAWPTFALEMCEYCTFNKTTGPHQVKNQHGNITHKKHCIHQGFGCKFSWLCERWMRGLASKNTSGTSGWGLQIGNPGIHVFHGNFWWRIRARTLRSRKHCSPLTGVRREGIHVGWVVRVGNMLVRNRVWNWPITSFMHTHHFFKHLIIQRLITTKGDAIKTVLSSET